MIHHIFRGPMFQRFIDRAVEVILGIIMGVAIAFIGYFAIAMFIGRNQ